MSEQENENLRELLQRLQNENMMLKQAAFTFTAPRNNVANSTTAAPPLNNHMQFNFASPGAGPSKSPVQQPAQSHQFDINFNSLIPFDPNTLNPAEDFGTDMDMNVDSFPFAGTYKTIASNPMFTSFAEPSPSDSPPLLVNGSHQFTPGSFDSFTEHWTPPEGSQDALEQLFGGNFLSPNANSVADFQALLASSPSSISPISLRTPSLSSAGSSPPGATGGSSPHTANGSPALHHMGDCPKTKEDLAKAVVAQGQSSFVNSPPATSSPSAGSDKASPSANGGAACEMPFAPVLKKSQDASGAGPFVTCQGSSFPKTEKSDKNVEVLAAWRSITSNPQFKVGLSSVCMAAYGVGSRVVVGAGCGHQRFVLGVHEQGAVRRDEGRARARGRAPHHRDARSKAGAVAAAEVAISVVSILPVSTRYGFTPLPGLHSVVNTSAPGPDTVNGGASIIGSLLPLPRSISHLFYHTRTSHCIRTVHYQHYHRHPPSPVALHYPP